MPRAKTRTKTADPVTDENGIPSGRPVTIEDAADTLFEPIETKAAKSAGKPHRKNAEIGAVLDMIFMGAFQMVAMATQHEHWCKTQDQVRAATEPLRCMIEQLPPKTVKAIEGRALPVSFVIGLGVMVIPDVILELHIRKLEAEARSNQRQGRRAPVGNLHPAAPQSPPGGADGVPGYGGRTSPEVTFDARIIAADTGLRGLD